jgi:hypothetical protein
MTQHGTLKQRNGDAVLVGEYINAGDSWFHFQIDGNKNINGFLTSEWDFVPDVTLPTEDGIYVSGGCTDPAFRGYALYQLWGGKWTNVHYNDNTPENYLKGLVEDYGPLKRLVMEEA